MSPLQEGCLWQLPWLPALFQMVLLVMKSLVSVMC
jgi:hypothetical protein